LLEKIGGNERQDQCTYINSESSAVGASKIHKKHSKRKQKMGKLPMPFNSPIFLNSSHDLPIYAQPFSAVCFPQQIQPHNSQGLYIGNYQNINLSKEQDGVTYNIDPEGIFYEDQPNRAPLLPTPKVSCLPVSLVISPSISVVPFNSSFAGNRRAHTHLLHNDPSCRNQTDTMVDTEIKDENMVDQTKSPFTFSCFNCGEKGHVFVFNFKSHIFLFFLLFFEIVLLAVLFITPQF
jgi:hypothetical protein